MKLPSLPENLSRYTSMRRTQRPNRAPRWFVRLSEIMASASKHRRSEHFSVEQVLELLEEDNNSDDGMTSGEESDLDRQLQNESCESR